MIITKRELKEWQNSSKTFGLVEFVTRLRKKEEMVNITKTQETIEVKVKKDRKELMLELDSKGIEYKKNAPTAKLEELLKGE